MDKQSIIEQKSIIESIKSIDSRENNNNTFDSKRSVFSDKIIKDRNEEDTNKEEDVKELKIDEELFKSQKTEDLVKIMKKFELNMNVMNDKYNEMKVELDFLKKKYQEIWELLGYIQMREEVKNILNPYEYLLSPNDLIKIEKENVGKWKLISDKIKQYYDKYKDMKNYKVFIEIVEKCVKALSEGNEGAHHIKMEFYEAEIKDIIKEFNNLFIDPIKICFLIKIKVSKSLLKDGYDLLDRFFENDMTRKIIRSYSLENYFNEFE